MGHQQQFLLELLHSVSGPSYVSSCWRCWVLTAVLLHDGSSGLGPGPQEGLGAELKIRAFPSAHLGLPFNDLGLGLCIPPGASHFNLPCLDSPLCSMGLATPVCEDSYKSKSEATPLTLCANLSYTPHAHTITPLLNGYHKRRL